MNKKKLISHGEEFQVDLDTLSPRKWSITPISCMWAAYSMGNGKIQHNVTMRNLTLPQPGGQGQHQ